MVSCIYVEAKKCLFELRTHKYASLYRLASRTAHMEAVLPMQPSPVAWPWSCDSPKSRAPEGTPVPEGAMGSLHIYTNIAA